MLRAFAYVFALTAIANAHPVGVTVSPEIGEWFTKQRNIQGGICCNLSDAYILSDTEWRLSDDGFYYVDINGVWRKVPPIAARDTRGGPNPMGHALVWHNNLSGDDLRIYCFAPGTMY